MTEAPMRRNLFYSTVSAGSAVLLMVLVALIARTMGEGAWGQFSWALALATIGEALMDLGIHQVTIRSIARERETALSLFRNSLALKALPGVAMFVVLAGAAMWWRPEPQVRLACVWLLCSAVLRSYLLTIRGVLQGLERFAEDSLVVLADRALLLLVGGIALWMHVGIVGLAVAFVIARVIAVVAALLVARSTCGPARAGL